MAVDFLKRDLLITYGEAEARTEACWLETCGPREKYLTQLCVQEELATVTLNRELSLPENPGKANIDSDGLFSTMGDGCSVSDQDRSLGHGVAMEISNAFIARSKRWQDRNPQLAGGTGPKPNNLLPAETAAVEATMQATQSHLEMINNMRNAVEEGILQRQDKIDETEFKLATTRAKAAIHKLQSLEYHFMSGLYKAEDIVALNKIWEELTTRIHHLKTQFTEAQRRLTVYRGLGPAFHEQLAQFRDVQRRLLDAQYMLENFNKINSELESGAVDMMMMEGSHLACDDGGFVVY